MTHLTAFALRNELVFFPSLFTQGSVQTLVWLTQTLLIFNITFTVLTPTFSQLICHVLLTQKPQRKQEKKSRYCSEVQRAKWDDVLYKQVEIITSWSFTSQVDQNVISSLITFKSQVDATHMEMCLPKRKDLHSQPNNT